MKLSLAGKLVEFSERRLAGMSTDETDLQEPWSWPGYFGSWATLDDNGEDFTAEFDDDSRARWTNTERKWEVVG